MSFGGWFSEMDGGRLSDIVGDRLSDIFGGSYHVPLSSELSTASVPHYRLISSVAEPYGSLAKV